jgi:type VI secretion system VasD/TssJ family lipoprotein
MITRDEFVLAPAERRTIDVTLSGETRFVGAVAAFRDIRNAQWRVLLPAPRTSLNVTVERARIVLTAAN